MPEYPIIYDASFLLFWGISLALGLYAGGLLTFALVAMMMLVLISHEHAHLKQCVKLNVKVNSVRFTWLGGMVDADIRDADYAVRILSAGVIDTGCYSVSFAGLFIALYYFNPPTLNFANIHFLGLLNGINMFLIVMCITNILPISYTHKKHGIISTDGWATLRFIELRDELWNDGRAEAMMHGNR